MTGDDQEADAPAGFINGLRHRRFPGFVAAQERRDVDDGDGALAHGGVMVSRRLARGHIRQRPHACRPRRDQANSRSGGATSSPQGEGEYRGP